jgi:hypothetical protein
MNRRTVQRHCYIRLVKFEQKEHIPPESRFCGTEAVTFAGATLLHRHTVNRSKGKASDPNRKNTCHNRLPLWQYHIECVSRHIFAGVAESHRVPGGHVTGFAAQPIDARRSRRRKVCETENDFVSSLEGTNTEDWCVPVCTVLVRQLRMKTTSRD